MSKGVCRVGDTVTGTCKAPVAGHPRPFTGTWLSGSGVVTADGVGVVRQGDDGITDCGHPFTANGGSIATADGKSIQRIGDSITLTKGGDGVSSGGSSTVVAD